MKILAIVVLGASLVCSFSTTKRKPKSQTDVLQNDDPDLAFIQPYDFDGSRAK
jgi:hypothetical protein